MLDPLTKDGVSQLATFDGKLNIDITVQILRVNRNRFVHWFAVVVSDGAHWLPAFLAWDMGIDSLSVDYFVPAAIIVESVVPFPLKGTRIGLYISKWRELDSISCSGLSHLTSNPARYLPNTTASNFPVQVLQAGIVDYMTVPIRVLVTYKSDMDYASTSYFNLHLLDESGEVEAIAYEAVADDLYSKFEVGKVYLVWNAIVVPALRKWSQRLGYRYALKLTKATMVMEYPHDVGSRPQLALRFDNVIPISNLYEIKEETLCDILAIVIYVDEIRVNFKPEGTTTSPVITRSLFVLDQSEHWVQVTLWEKQAYELKVQEGEILALRHVKVSGYRGRTISVLSNSTVHMHPHEALPLQCEALARWYKQLGSPRGLDDFTGQTRIVDIDKLQKVPVRVSEDYENMRDWLQQMANVLHSAVKFSITGNFDLFN